MRPQSGSFIQGRDLSKPDRRFCCCCFLQTGVTLLIIGDMLLLILITLFFFSILFFQIRYQEILRIHPVEYFIYWYFTSGLIITLLIIKCFYGTKFVYYSSRCYRSRLLKKAEDKKEQFIKIQFQQSMISCNSSIDESSAREEHIQKWLEQVTQQTRKTVVKHQRRVLEKFFISSTVYYMFVILLDIGMTPVILA